MVKLCRKCQKRGQHHSEEYPRSFCTLRPELTIMKAREECLGAWWVGEDKYIPTGTPAPAPGSHENLVTDLPPNMVTAAYRAAFVEARAIHVENNPGAYLGYTEFDKLPTNLQKAFQKIVSHWVFNGGS
jgi:hypothetical protein